MVSTLLTNIIFLPLVIGGGNADHFSDQSRDSGYYHPVPASEVLQSPHGWQTRLHFEDGTGIAIYCAWNGPCTQAQFGSDDNQPSGEADYSDTPEQVSKPKKSRGI